VRCLAACGFVMMMLAATRAHGACQRTAPLSRLGATTAHLSSLPSLGLVVGSPLPLLMMAPTGADHALRLVAQRDLGGRPNLEPVSVLFPYVAFTSLLSAHGAAATSGDCSTARVTAAMLEAMSLSFAATVSLKWATGRAWPLGGGDPAAPDRLSHPELARRFHFFSSTDGLAWPSGHTAVMVAASTALATSEHVPLWLQLLGFSAATGVAVGMWVGDHHWASDIVSGAMLGIGIGHGVGRAFREPAPMQPAFGFTPWLSPRTVGLNLTFSEGSAG